jgi:hypothetical protein
VFRYSLVDFESGEALGVVAFATSSFKRGELILHASGRTLRVLSVLESREEAPDRFPVLVAEPVN